MDALLIIDMQKTSFEEIERYDAKGVVQRINDLAASARRYGDMVIFIQHDGTEQDGHKPFTRGWEILDELVQKNSDLVVRKSTCDSFYQTSLESALRELGAKRLIITGCATDFCVDTAIRSALSKDFSLLVPEDAHTTANRPHLTAAQVIEHHNWVWKNLLPNEQEIPVIPAANIYQHKELSQD